MTEQTIHTTVRQSRIKTTVENPTTTVTTQAVPLTVSGDSPADLVTQVVYAGKPGPPGPEGPEGPQGLQGAPGTGSGAYVHTQNSPASVWTIVHGLDFFPNVSVVDSAGSVVEGEVDYLDGSTVQVTFSAAFSGVAYLS